MATSRRSVSFTPAWTSRRTFDHSVVAGRALLRVKALLLHRFAKPVLFGLSLLPFCWLLFAAIDNQLGANPAQALVRATGDWTLRFLCLTLGVTPLRVMTGTPAMARFRRMLGLFVYFHGVLHLVCYSWFDMGFDFTDMAKDIAKRPFILVGFSAFLLLTALALTSFNRAIRTLGAKNWQRLHRLVYVIAGLATLHFFWMRSAKNDLAEVCFYGTLLGLLLLWRWLRHLRPS